MTRSTVSRLLETFFRRWWLYLLPVVVLSAFGALQVLGTATTYRSSATVSVADTTLLSTLSDVRSNPNYGFETAAEVTARRFNNLLGTELFATSVAEAAGLTDDIDAGLLTLDDIRSSVYAAASRTSLLRVIAVTASPDLAPRLVSASMDEFVELVVAEETADSGAAEAFYADLAAELKVDVDQAQADVDAFLLANPALGPAEERPESAQIELDRLNARLNQAEARYESALNKSLDAQLAARQSEADVSQRLIVVDQPSNAVPAGSLRQSIMAFAPFLALGMILAGVAVVGAALLDHSIRSPQDVQDRLGLRSLAFVPQVDPVRLREVRLANAGGVRSTRSPASMPVAEPPRQPQTPSPSTSVR